MVSKIFWGPFDGTRARSRNERLLRSEILNKSKCFRSPNSGGRFPISKVRPPGSGIRKNAGTGIPENRKLASESVAGREARAGNGTNLAPIILKNQGGGKCNL